MKIAINLSGTQKWPDRSMQAVEMLSKIHDVSVFSHFWKNDTETLNRHSWNFLHAEYLGDADQNILQYPNLKMFKSENFTDRLEEFEKTFKSIPYHARNATQVGPISMFYSMHQCDKLIKEYEQINGTFDLIIRMRFDCRLPDASALDDLPIGKIIVPHGCDDLWEETPGSLNDLFAVGPSALMHEYFDVYPNIVDYCKIGCIFYGEGLCGTHILIRRIPVVRRALRFCAHTNEMRNDESFFHPPWRSSFGVTKYGDVEGVIHKDSPHLERIAWFYRYSPPKPTLA